MRKFVLLLSIFLLFKPLEGLRENDLLTLVQQVDSLNIFEFFKAEDHYQSVLLNWKLSSSSDNGWITIKRSENLSDEFETITQIPDSLSSWKDWNVEVEKVYFYQLIWEDRFGKVFSTSKKTPPFASPLSLPEETEILKIESLMNPELPMILSKGKNFLIPITIAIDSQVYQGEIFQGYSLEFPISLHGDSTNLTLYPVRNFMDLFNYIIIQPIVFSLSFSVEDDPVRWIEWDQKSLGLFFIERTYLAEVGHEEESLYTKFIEDLCRELIEPFWETIEYSPSSIPFQWEELSNESIQLLKNNLNKLIQENKIPEMVSYFDKKYAFLNPRILDKEQERADKNRLLTLSIETVIQSWLDELNHSLATEWNQKDKSGMYHKEVKVPEVFALYQNYPNPFNEETTIRFDLLEEAILSLVIVDARGEEVDVLIDEAYYPPGQYSFAWKVAHFSSGIYIFSLKAVVREGEVFVDSRKMIYLK